MGILSGTDFHRRIEEPPALSHGRYDGAGGLLLWYDMMVLVWMTVSRFVCAVNGGVREQRKTEGQPKGLTLRQRDSERNSSGPSPELIGPGPENQALLHNGSGIAEAGLRGTHDGLSLSGTASAEGELIRAHARLTLYPTMGRLPVLRTDPTMTVAGYHSPESSVGSQSWSRDMSHGRARYRSALWLLYARIRGKSRVSV